MPDAWTDLPPPPVLARRPPAPPGVRYPRVSIVLTTYRRPHMIGATIRSLLAQSLGDFEMLVRDDGTGDDGTEEAVRVAAAGDVRVKYHRNPKNLRMPGNLNSGIQDSTGDLIAVCHDHDLYHPDFLARLVGLLEKHPSALYAHAGIGDIDQEGGSRGTQLVGSWAELTPGRAWLGVLLKSFGCPVCALAVVRREAHERFGLYDPTYGFISDVELWMRLSMVGDVAYAAAPLVLVRDRETEHDAIANPWPNFVALFDMHRRYLHKHYRGLELLARLALLDARADFVTLREIGWRMRHRRTAGIPQAAVPPLCEASGPVTRRLLPLLAR